MPTLHIVAGPNGSGKSTLTRSRRFGGAHVIDPDAIARRIAFNLQNSVAGTPTIDKVVFRSIPNEDTMAAELLAGGLDVTRIFGKDLGENLAKRKHLSATAVNSFRYYYLALDAKNRSGVKALADVRVRRAIAHSINRKEIVSQVLAGGKAAILLNSPCIPSQIGCRVTNAPAEFNVAKAKALLKEAGYEKGFALRLTGTKEAASLREAVVGYMRKVGIKATAQSLPIVSYRKLRGQGKIAGLLNIYGSGGIPDVAKVFDFYWQGPKHRNDYHHDPVLFKTRKAAATTFDKKARDAMFLKAFNHNNDQVYVIPFASAPTVLVHTKDLDIPYDFSTNAYGLDLSNAHWKK